MCASCDTSRLGSLHANNFSCNRASAKIVKYLVLLEPAVVKDLPTVLCHLWSPMKCFLPCLRLMAFDSPMRPRHTPKGRFIVGVLALSQLVVLFCSRRTKCSYILYIPSYHFTPCMKWLWSIDICTAQNELYWFCIHVFFFCPDGEYMIHTYICPSTKPHQLQLSIMSRQ